MTGNSVKITVVFLSVSPVCMYDTFSPVFPLCTHIFSCFAFFLCTAFSPILFLPCAHFLLFLLSTQTFSPILFFPLRTDIFSFLSPLPLHRHFCPFSFFPCAHALFLIVRTRRNKISISDMLHWDPHRQIHTADRWLIKITPPAKQVPPPPPPPSWINLLG